MAERKILDVTGVITKEEKAEFRGSSYYRGKNRCITLREHTLDFTTEKNHFYDTAVTEKDIIRMYFQTLKSVAEDPENKDLNEKEMKQRILSAKTEFFGELKDLVSQGIEDRFKAQEVTRDLLRYFKSEDRTPILPRSKYFVIDGEKVRIRPDLVFDDGKTVEVVFFRSCKPDVTMRSKKNDIGVNQSIELWQGTIYARSMVPKDETRNIKSAYYFLRKDNDRAFGAYDWNFFGSSGKNVVYLLSDDVKDKNGLLPLDMGFFTQLDEFREGTECSEDDCKTCPNHVVCNYQKSPEQFEQKSLDSKRKKVELSPTQEEIVSFRNGLCRVIAKAGTGKTECMTERGARMYEEGVNPKSMLFVTFTDAGALEMKERLIVKSEMRGLHVSADDIPAMTFHTLGYGFIKDLYKELGFDKVPSIIDTNEARKGKLIDQVLQDADFYTMENRYNALDWAIKSFDTIKAEEINPDDPAAAVSLKEALDSSGAGRFMSSSDVDKMIEMYKDYVRICKENCWLTFNDIEPLMNRVLSEYPDYLEELGFEHIIVDEFQDSNDKQLTTIKHLISTKCFKSLMVVGDDCQSIYGFRNTSQENILHFWEKIGATGKDLYLVENRRSTPEILSFADTYISMYNEEQADSHMTAVRDHGFKPVVRGFAKKEEEQKFIVENILRCHDKGHYAWEDIAVIGATKAELVTIAASLSEAGIPWITKYPMPLVENSRVQAAISLGMAFYQPDAENLYFNYLVALNDGDIFNEMTNEEIKGKVAELKAEWMGMDFKEIPYQRKIFHEKLEAIKGNDELYAYFIDLVYENEDLQSELEYINDFRKFGERVAKKLEQDYAGVVLTTAHSSKGLEWPIVFNTVTKYDNKSMHTGRDAASKAEERRRLLYVSMTRARDILYLTGQFVAYGSYGDYTYNQFLQELFTTAKMDYDPAAAINAERAKTAAKKKSDSKSKAMAEEEIMKYEKMIAGCKQMTLKLA